MLLADHSKSIELALEEKLPGLEGKMPEFVTKEIHLDIMMEVARHICLTICKIGKKYVLRDGSVDQNHEEFIEEYGQVDIDEFRIETIKKLGFDEFIDHPLLIYKVALDEFMKDQSFCDDIKKFEDWVQSVVQEFYKGIFYPDR